VSISAYLVSFSKQYDSNTHLTASIAGQDKVGRPVLAWNLWDFAAAGDDGGGGDAS